LTHLLLAWTFWKSVLTSAIKRRSTPRPFWAVVCVLLVLTLDVLAASPSAHAWIHHGSHADGLPDDDGDDDGDGHECAITHFAHGHGGFAVAPTLLPFLRLRQIATFSVADVRAILSPAFLRPHCCGPPSV
jgi:hypothetical protein